MDTSPAAFRFDSAPSHFYANLVKSRIRMQIPPFFVFLNNIQFPIAL